VQIQKSRKPAIMSVGSSRWPCRLLAVSLLAGLLALHAPIADARVFWSTDPGNVSVIARNPEALMLAVLAAVNQFRAEHHLPPVRLDPRLNQVAQAHADFMATHQTLSHTGANGLNPSQRLASVGYRWICIAENVAAGQTTAEEVVQDWIDSPRHRANILKAAVTDIGIGHNNTYWTLDLAGESSAYGNSGLTENQ
jgi:uncharacterized protein YkwD